MISCCQLVTSWLVAWRLFVGTGSPSLCETSSDSLSWERVCCHYAEQISICRHYGKAFALVTRNKFRFVFVPRITNLKHEPYMQTFRIRDSYLGLGILCPCLGFRAGYPLFNPFHSILANDNIPGKITAAAKFPSSRISYDSRWCFSDESELISRNDDESDLVLRNQSKPAPTTNHPATNWLVTNCPRD